jgi:hypothetical protein
MRMTVSWPGVLGLTCGVAGWGRVTKGDKADKITASVEEAVGTIESELIPVLRSDPDEPQATGFRILRFRSRDERPS